MKCPILMAYALTSKTISVTFFNGATRNHTPPHVGLHAAEDGEFSV